LACSVSGFLMYNRWNIHVVSVFRFPFSMSDFRAARSRTRGQDAALYSGTGQDFLSLIMDQNILPSLRTCVNPVVYACIFQKIEPFRSMCYGAVSAM
jgi:hypothetical protein